MSICRYEIKSIRYEELVKIVKLPKFQRSVVWSDDTRNELVKTIKKGFPFGSLLY